MKIAIYCLVGTLFSAVQAPAGDRLPAGVPHTVDTNGNIVEIPFTFTTPEYQREALKLLIEEANRVAVDLNLEENCPITESNVVRRFIPPFGYAYDEKAVGNIMTTNYWYFVIRDYKFNCVTVVNMDDRCREYATKYQWSPARLDTNTPYQVATQWLTAVRVDVEGLNRDYDMRVALDGYWNNVEMGGIPRGKFTPLYVVSWLKKGFPPYSAGGGASVQLFLPTKTLLSLSVNDPKYILRPPLVFTNLEALFPGKATIKTNSPSEPIVVDGDKWLIGTNNAPVKP